MRSPGGGDNLYLNSLVAIDRESGRMNWHFQETPADNWDLTATQPMILADLETVLRKSDIISIHAPSIPETNDMFNKDTLALMKKDAILINTARGSIINEADLYAHMKAGNLKYACIDVFNPEPPAVDNPLRTLPNVIMTPHLAGLAANGKLRIGMHAAEEIEKFLAGEKMDCEATRAMLATMA